MDSQNIETQNIETDAPCTGVPCTQKDMGTLIETGRKVADAMAIPMFLLLILYLTNSTENKSFVRDLLLFFAVVGLLADTLFTYNFVRELSLRKRVE